MAWRRWLGVAGFLTLTLPLGSGLAAAGNATLEPEACVPWRGLRPPQERSACEVTERPASGWVTRKQYDAAGNLLEFRNWNPQGVLTNIQTHAWANGLEVFSREEHPPSSWWTETAWQYDLRRRLQVLTKRSSSDPVATVQRYTYAGERLERIDTERSGRTVAADLYVYAGERLERIDHASPPDKVIRSTLYVYDSAGLLKSVYTLEDDGTYVPSVTEYTYHANGKYKSIERSGSSASYSLEEYDTLGRIIRRDENSHQSGGEGSSYNTWTYDEANRVTHTADGNNQIWASWVTDMKYVHDAEGREVLAYRRYERSSYHDDLDLLEFSTYRTTYLCGSALPHHKDTDGNGDGIVDSRCTYQRDSRGTLLRVECTTVPSSGTLSSSDYRYDCR